MKFAKSLLASVRLSLLPDETLKRIREDCVGIGACVEVLNKVLESKVKPTNRCSSRHCDQGSFQIAVFGGYYNVKEKAVAILTNFSASNLTTARRAPMPQERIQSSLHKRRCLRGTCDS